MMLRKLPLLILKQRAAALVLLLAVTVLMIQEASQVKFSYEGAKLLPADNPAYREHLSFKKIFGEDGSVMVIGFEGENIFRINAFAHLYDLSNEIKKIDGIQEVVSPAKCYHVIRNDSLQRLELKPLPAEKPSSQQEVAAILDTIKSLPFYKGLLLSDSANVTLMAITFNQDKLNTKNRIDIVKNIKEKTE